MQEDDEGFPGIYLTLSPASSAHNGRAKGWFVVDGLMLFVGPSGCLTLQAVSDRQTRYQWLAPGPERPLGLALTKEDLARLIAALTRFLEEEMP